LLLRKGIDVPEQWRYDPEYKLNYILNYEKDIVTTAMVLATYKIIPPTYFEHDPLIKDTKYDMTVAMALAN